MTQVAATNIETQQAWDGVLFDRFVQYRPIVMDGLTPHGEEVLAANPPASGERVIDIGCGFGDTSRRIASMVGPEGEVLGVDISPRFVEASRQEAEEAGVANVRFEVADVEIGPLEGGFDYAFSRFGTMFFANPVAALRNVSRALVPGGRLGMVVWRAKALNEWVHRAEQAVERLIGHPDPEDSEEPTCGPGPFSMANPDTTSQILINAGFHEIGFLRVDLPYRIGADLDEAVSFVTALGPAGEMIRLAGEAAEARRAEIDAAVRNAYAEFATPDGVYVPSTTWVVSARMPAA